MSTDIHWPSELPKPLRSGHNDRARSRSLVTQFGLLDRSRPIYSAAPSEVTVSWKFTASELWYFRGFYAHGLDGGNLWFWCPMYVGGVLEAR